jgi:hypothetical protein
MKQTAFWREKRRVCSMFKILSTYICWKKYIKCKIWRVAVRPSYIQDAWFLKLKLLYNLTTPPPPHTYTYIYKRMNVGNSAKYLRRRSFTCTSLRFYEYDTLRDRWESCCRNMQLQDTYINGDSYCKAGDAYGQYRARWQPAPANGSVVVLPMPLLLDQKVQKTFPYVNLISLLPTTSFIGLIRISAFNILQNFVDAARFVVGTMQPLAFQWLGPVYIFALARETDFLRLSKTRRTWPTSSFDR